MPDINPVEYLYCRRSIRLRDYDYSKPGLYFITICSYQRFHYFGEINNNVIGQNDLGNLVSDEWLRILQHRPNIKLLDFCIMPNHLHGIIHITEKENAGWAQKGTTSCAPTERFGSPTKGSIPTIIRSFKAGVTGKIMKVQGEIYNKIWQRGYFEHIIRNESEKQRIIEYINNNAINWDRDIYNAV